MARIESSEPRTGFSWSRRRAVMVLTLVAATCLLAGCGGGGPQRAAEPLIAHGDAARLITLASSIARDAPVNGCAARREIAALDAAAHTLVSAGRVPAVLRTQLLSGVAAVSRTAPACVVTPAPNPEPSHGHQGHVKHAHGHQHGHEHGRDD